MQTDNNKDKSVDIFVRKIKRRERYEQKRKAEEGIAYFGSEDDYGFSSAVYRMWQSKEQQKKSYEALYQALDDLSRIDPAGHKLIVEYYFSGEKITFTEIGRKYGISRQACTKKIRKCLTVLKSLVELHRNNG